MRFYKKVRPFKVISFDLDDTLYDNSKVIERAEHWYAQYLQQHFHLPQYTTDPNFWRTHRLNLAASNADLDHDVTYLRCISQIEIFKQLNLQLSERESLDLIDRFIDMRSNIKISDDIITLLKELKKHYVLASLSNGNVSLARIGLSYLFKYNLRPKYKHLKRKPFSDLFDELASLEHIEHHNILHVGDDPETDVQGALFANCQTAFLKGGIALRRSLILPRSLPHIELDNIFELRKLIDE